MSKEEHMSWKTFEEGCKKIVEQIIKSEIKIDNIFGIPRGGLVLAVRLSHLLNKHLTRNIASINRKTLIVDDISDTGKTLKRFEQNYIATLYIKPKTETIPNFYVFKTSKWIVFPWEEK